MGGYVSQAILHKGEAAGAEALAKLRDCFPEGRFYVELQDHGFPEQRPLNNVLARARARSGAAPRGHQRLPLPRAAARPAAQLVLQCIGAGRTLGEMERMHHGSSEMYLKSPEEMVARFRHVPEAHHEHAPQIAEMCAGKVNPLSNPKLPRFKVPGGDTEEAYLADQARRGLEVRLADMDRRNIPFERKVYEDRLEVETQIINQMGFPGYFLIVQDFINWAKDNDVPVGPGRGSGAGSHRRLQPAHHGPRPAALRPAVRALPEPRARVHARLRRRLLHGQARAGHRLRARHLRQAVGRADRHVPPAQEPQRGEGRGPASWA